MEELHLLVDRTESEPTQNEPTVLEKFDISLRTVRLAQFFYIILNKVAGCNIYSK